MLFRHHAARCRRIPRTRSCVTNWPAHEAGLRRRGVWCSTWPCAKPRRSAAVCCACLDCVVRAGPCDAEPSRTGVRRTPAACSGQCWPDASCVGSTGRELFGQGSGMPGSTAGCAGSGASLPEPWTPTRARSPAQRRTAPMTASLPLLRPRHGSAIRRRASSCRFGPQRCRARTRRTAAVKPARPPHPPHGRAGPQGLAEGDRMRQAQPSRDRPCPDTNT